MGKLQGLRSYLSGYIQNSSDFGAEWRKDIKPFLKNLGVVVLDPLNKPIEMGFGEGEGIHDQLNKWIEDNEYEKVIDVMKKIRWVDLRLCDVCDFVIFYLDNDIQTIGSWEEVFSCNKQVKPILVVCKQGVKKIPKWLWGTLPVKYFFNNFDEMKEYLLRIDSEDKKEEIGRWKLFDYSKLN